MKVLDGNMDEHILPLTIGIIAILLLLIYIIWNSYQLNDPILMDFLDLLK